MARRVDKLRLIDTLGRKSQAEMTYDEIKAYLREFKVDAGRPTSGFNSKWRYVKDLLSDEPIERILDIADDLEVAHGHVRPGQVGVADTRFWLPGYFRLFLSHVSDFKAKTAQLQSALKGFAATGKPRAPPNKPLQRTAAPRGDLMPGASRPWWSTRGSLVATGCLQVSRAAAAERRYAT